MPSTFDNDFRSRAEAANVAFLEEGIAPLEEVQVGERPNGRAFAVVRGATM
jgi:hypothetical protein